DKEVNMEAGDYDGALVCCVKNMTDDRIMDSGASFHATYCKEELERFKLRSGKFRLVDDKTLDIAGVGDVVLKISFGTSWTLKDVSLVVARGNKRGSMYMVEVPSDGINTTIDDRGNATLWHQRLGHMSEKGIKILASKGRIPDLQKAVVGFCEPCVLGKQKKVSFIKFVNTRKLQRLDLFHTDVYGPTSVASIGGSRYYVTFIDDSSRKEDSVTTATYLINRGPFVPLGFRIPEEEWQGKEVSLAHLRVFGCDSYVKVKDVARDKQDAKSVNKDVTFNKESLYGAKAAIDFSNLTKPNQKDQVVLEDSLKNLVNKSIVIEHGLSLEITQSPGGSSDMSEGSNNSRSFEDSGRSDEEGSEDNTSSKEGGFETPQLRRSTRESKAPKKAINEEMVEKNQTWSLLILLAGKKAFQSKWVFNVKEEQDGKKRYKTRLVVKGFQQKHRVDYNEIFSPVLKMNIIRHLHDITRGFSVSWERRKPRVQVEEKFIKKLKRQLSQKLEMKDLGPAKQILGMSIIRYKTKGTLRLSQEKYIGKVLEKFNMKDAEARCQPLGDHYKLSKKQAPKTKASRPDIAHVVRVVSKFMSSPRREHWEAIKWLLRYLKVVSWMSRIQKCVGMSTTEAEYIAIAEASKELVWLKNFLEELDKAQTKCVLFCDNQSVIHLVKNPMFYGRTKHIKIIYHYIRELVREGTLYLKKIIGAKNPTDMLTKVVTTEKLKLYAASTDSEITDERRLVSYQRERLFPV
ncbi:retrovirus-related pol polyprotein from transposon TNT 1-94, partial [Tanacetum coccineum]